MRRFFAVCLTAAAATIGISSASAEILISTAGPMTGQYASFGEQMKRGAEMAVNDLNAKGGVLGQKVAFTTGDDACDPKQAVAVANKFGSQGGKFVAGTSAPVLQSPLRRFTRRKIFFRFPRPRPTRS